ncbi:MAG: hypothetical protein ACM3PS_04440 [Syntrophothermus sp.]
MPINYFQSIPDGTQQSGYFTRVGMYLYQICGTSFQSNIPLPELIVCQQPEPKFTFQLHAGNKRHSKSYRWLNYWYSFDGRVWLAFARIDSGYLLRFPSYADFVISTDARTISAYRGGNTPDSSIRHLLLNQVIPIVLSQLGKLVLHASACVSPQGVMAFMGTTGMGKSTLAASFGLRGLQVLTDDCLSIEKQGNDVLCVPSYAGVRLWPESITALFAKEPELQTLAHYTDKKRFVFEQNASGESLFLKAAYVLTHPEEDPLGNSISITPLSSGTALLEAVKHTFQLDVTDRERLAQAFKRYEWLAQSVPFFQLRYPRDHAYLPAVNTAVLEHMARIQNREAVPA